MTSIRSWGAYPLSYRTEEMKTLAGWILAGQSGSVIGLAGAGKSNLLGFLCHRPEALQSYFTPQPASAVLIPVDLNNLPSNSLATFYRVILRSFYEVRDRFEQELRQATTELYQENRATRDSFLAQTALRDLLLRFEDRQMRVVLVIDRFDKFGQMATPEMLDTLRGVRDSFKSTLCYIVGMRQEMVYLFDPVMLGEMYELLDTHICWVGPMNETDARRLIAEETLMAPKPPLEADIAHLLALTGGYPALLKAACHWWSSSSEKLLASDWTDALLTERSIQSRMEEIWTGLTQEEQRALAEAQKRRVRDVPTTGGGGAMEIQYRQTLSRLADKGLCRQTDTGWCTCGDLFATYVTSAAGQVGGRIWLDGTTDELYQGQTPLRDLSPLARSVLHFLVRRPRVRHTKTDLIVSTWPDELRRQGVTDDSLYQVISELRKKIEPNLAQPCYVVTWRGRPEGGYQFFPEGRPG